MPSHLQPDKSELAHALPALLTVPEVAAWARVSPKTVYRWIKENKLAARQLGPRTYRVEPQAVLQFLKASGYGPLPAPVSPPPKR